MSHVYLIGFMGAGKSTVGRKVARILSLPFVDLDTEIERLAGGTAAAVFASHGEEHFRRVEQDVLSTVAAGPDSVVACGGGVVIKEENRSVLKTTGTVVYLRVSAQEAIARIGDTATRPLLAGGGASVAATALLDARVALYAAVSDYDFDTADRTPDEVAARVAAVISEVRCV